ncbi:branched-chain amino acid transaminase [Photobacterium leiognathi]|uniref:branched-chain amino acid transaminase n=1 Tax=Photobacterium leiognathi TaxID=553611 RepID=UPI002981771E|nr:branched-chain amino acid transaminase [Photobacterium leiognathi]
MKNESRLMWLSGNIIPVEDAKVNVLSPTSQFGLNVFEGLRGYWSEKDKQLYIFKLEEHCERLLKSIKMVRFECDYTVDFLKNAILDVVKANNFLEDIAIRQTVFVDGFGNWAATGPVDMFIAPIAKGRQLIDKDGISCCISSWERISDKCLPPKIKMGANYMNSRLGQMEAHRNGYDSTIFLNNAGKVSEGPGACLFIVRDGKLITPTITSSILESITRTTVIDIARNNLNLVVEEREIDRTELYIAEEVFMCGSAVEILPVLSVDKMPVGSGKKGLITQNIEQCYFDILRRDIIVNDSWLTPVY